MTVFLRGLQVYAYHGATSEEQTIGRRYQVNLEIEVPDKVGQSDSLADTVDYGAAGRVCTELLTERRFTTVEAAATALARELLERFPIASQVTIELAKLHPPGGLVVDAAGAWVLMLRGPDGTIGPWTE